jgi:hypothetical protein
MKSLGFKFQISVASLLAVMIFSQSAFSKEAPKEEKKEAKKEEEKKINQYQESITILNIQLEKIRENNEKVDRLVKEKAFTTDRNRALEIIAEINLLEKENKKFVGEARRLQYDIKYLFPDRGEETARLYKKHGMKELTEADEKSFAEKIDGVLAYAKKVYGPTQAEIEAAERVLLKKQEEEARKANDPKSRFERIKIDK